MICLRLQHISGVILLAATTSLTSAALGQSGTCGSHPPGVPPVRRISPYAGEPDDLRPFSKFTAPYYQHYVETNVYAGAGRDIPDPDLSTLSEIRIGFFGPIGTNPDHVAGTRMLNGAQMAIDDANAHGGYCGKPFKLMLHNDYDNWQAGQVYGPDRPTNEAIWGSSSNAVVQMTYDEKDWAIFGSISSESTHIILRVALRAEIPIINSASTDPTIPETTIPWYFTDIQDDRVQTLTLARRVYTELGLKRMAILRVNNRYGRFGVGKFRDASRRLGHPVVIEQKFRPGDTDYRSQLRIIQDSRVDGILVWSDQAEAAGILKQMHELGMKQRVFGSHRTIGDDLLRLAGTDAEGMEAVFPYDPLRHDSKWVDFNQRYEARFQEKPGQFSALAYDAMQILVDNIRKAGLNRARIHDALTQVYEYKGVTADMVFDTNAKNISPMYLATIHDGKISYRHASMEKLEPTETQAPTPEREVAKPSAALQNPQPVPSLPYARVGEDGIQYLGPAIRNLASGPTKLIVVGPGASEKIQSVAVAKVLKSADHSGHKLILAPVNSELSWGRASTGLVDLLTERQTAAIIALDRDSSHLAEQLSLKFFVPVLAISPDRSLTSINIPWIFRQPQGTALSQAIASLSYAINHVGPNPERIRDLLASGTSVAGLRFAPTGEPY